MPQKSGGQASLRRLRGVRWGLRHFVVSVSYRFVRDDFGRPFLTAAHLPMGMRTAWVPGSDTRSRTGADTSRMM